MAKRKKVKKRVSKKVSKKCCCNMNWACVLSSMAFILFLITVWGGAMDLVHKIHWGWFLGAMIVFGAIGWRKCCK